MCYSKSRRTYLLQEPQDLNDVTPYCDLSLEVCGLGLRLGLGLCMRSWP